MSDGLCDDVRSAGVASRLHRYSDTGTEKYTSEESREKNIYRYGYIKNTLIVRDTADGRHPEREKRRSYQSLESVFDTEYAHTEYDERDIYTERCETDIETEEVIEDVCNTCGSSARYLGRGIENSDAECGDERSENEIDDVNPVVDDMSGFLHSPMMIQSLSLLIQFSDRRRM